jgi:hypothetical protein
MRKPPGSNKEVGYVVIPLFLDRSSGETLEEALERSEFDDVADVLNAMQEQDDDLVQIIRELQEAKGRGEKFDPRKLLEKIEVIGPSIELSALRSNICAEVVDRVGVSWDEWYGRLTLYKDGEGHCSVPQRYRASDGYALGRWVSLQRFSQDKLSHERKARLDALGFDWNPYGKEWENGVEHLRAYADEFKHCFVPAQYKAPDGFKLGQWVANWRFRKDILSTEQIEILDALGFDWNPLGTAWEEGFEHLQAFVKEYKHCLVLQKYASSDSFKLGSWVQAQRLSFVSPERKARLDALGFDWNPHETAWDKGFEHLQAYADEFKHCRVPTEYKSQDGYRLGGWALKQRQKLDNLSAESKARLDALGFDWDPIGTEWENGFEHLQAYADEFKHCLVPAQYKALDGYRLGQWVQVGRSQKLSDDRKARLDALGFDWDPIATQWEEAFEHLTAYVKERQECRVPVQYRSPDGYRLGTWVFKQRQKQDNLSSDRKARLDALGFDWDPITTQREEGFEHLQAFVKEYKHCRVPAQYKSSDGYELGDWVDRLKQSSVSPEHKARLDALDFDWRARHDMAWEDGLEHLRAFVNEHKHCQVPHQYKSPDGYNLGNWVSNKRRRGPVSAERKARLDALGFDWKVAD